LKGRPESVFEFGFILLFYQLGYSDGLSRWLGLITVELYHGMQWKKRRKIELEGDYKNGSKNLAG